jgi:hypothetical protein
MQELLPGLLGPTFIHYGLCTPLCNIGARCRDALLNAENIFVKIKDAPEILMWILRS